MFFLKIFLPRIIIFLVTLMFFFRNAVFVFSFYAIVLCAITIFFVS